MFFNAAMLTNKLYFHPHPCVNLDRSVFIHTQAFYYACWFNDPFHQNVPGSLNILLLNVSWSKDADSSAGWLMNDEQVMFSIQALLSLPECVNWCVGVVKGHEWSVRQHNSRSSHLLYWWYEMVMPWPGFQSIPFYLIIIHSINMGALMTLHLC